MSAPNKPHPVTSLPFVFDRPKKVRGEPPRSFWHVQPTDDFFEDCATGGRYAAAYLRFAAADDDRGYLVSIVTDMCAALAQRERSGIEMGFLGAIEVGAVFGRLRAEQYALSNEHGWRMYGKGALVNTRPDGSVVIEQLDGTRAVYRKGRCGMRAEIIPLQSEEAFARLIRGIADQQDAIYFAIRAVDAAIASLKAQKAVLLRAYHAELDRPTPGKGRAS